MRSRLERLAQRPQLVDEELDRPEVGIVRPVGAPTAELVVDDDAAALVCQLLERLEVVVRGAGPAVEAHERDSALRAYVAVPRVEPAERDATLDDPHGRRGSMIEG